MCSYEAAEEYLETLDKCFKSVEEVYLPEQIFNVKEHPHPILKLDT